MNTVFRPAFNQNSTCVACGTQNGFVIYNCDPLSKRFLRQSKDFSTVSIVEMLYKSNIFAIVGADPMSKFPPNKVIIWDDLQSKMIAEFEFHTAVRGVKMRRDTIMIAVQNKTYLYNFENLKMIKNYDTTPNPNGFCSMSLDDSLIVAVMGIVPGTILIDNITAASQKIINAHSSPIATFALNTNGSLLATASERGTLIRIWNPFGEMVKELRRGLEPATINSITFNEGSSRIAVCSDKETCHIFSINTNEANRKSSLNYLSGYLPQYFSSEWSPLSISVPQNSLCTFAPNSEDTMYIITVDGTFCKYYYSLRNSTSKCTETVSLSEL